MRVQLSFLCLTTGLQEFCGSACLLVSVWKLTSLLLGCSFGTVDTKCLSPTSALILNTPAYVPGFDEKDGDSYCNLLTWDATTVRS